MIGKRSAMPGEVPMRLSLAGLVAVVIGLTVSPAADAGSPRTRVTSGAMSSPSIIDLPLQFEANQGQVDPRVRFLGRGHGYTVFLVVKVFPARGGSVTLSANGTVTYKPLLGFSGTDRFTYQVADGKGGTATGGVTVIVNSRRARLAYQEDLS